MKRGLERTVPAVVVAAAAAVAAMAARAAVVDGVATVAAAEAAGRKGSEQVCFWALAERPLCFQPASVTPVIRCLVEGERVYTFEVMSASDNRGMLLTTEALRREGFHRVIKK